MLVDEILPAGRSDLQDVYVTHLRRTRLAEVDRASAHRGSRLAAVGRTARPQIETLLGTKVYLNLHVTVAKEWQRDPKQLRRLGFDPA